MPSATDAASAIAQSMQDWLAHQIKITTSTGPRYTAVSLTSLFNAIWQPLFAIADLRSGDRDDLTRACDILRGIDFGAIDHSDFEALDALSNTRDAALYALEARAAALMVL